MGQVRTLNPQSAALVQAREMIEAMRSRMPRPPRLETEDLILIWLHIPLVGCLIAQDFLGF